MVRCEAMSVEVPAGLADLLQAFTVEVLRNRPDDLIAFAADYFLALQQRRRQAQEVESVEEIRRDGDHHQDDDEDGEDRGVNFTSETRTDSSSDSEFEPPVINRFKRRSSVCGETYNPDEEDEDSEPRVIHPKTDEQRARLQEACKNILLFKNVDEEQLSQVLDAMFEKTVENGEHVIDQGDDGDNFYVIERGTFDIFVVINNESCLVGSYDNQGSFGELALMYNTPRAATIVATSEGSLWGLDRETFRRIIVKNTAKKRQMYESFIETVPLLKSLDLSERIKVVDVIESRTYQDGERIIAQGDKADCLFIVECGDVRIAMRRKLKEEPTAIAAMLCIDKPLTHILQGLDDVVSTCSKHYTPIFLSVVEMEGGEVEITRCGRGQYFGELALVTNKPRAASAYAVGEVKCAVMDVKAFERLLGPCMDIMKRNIAHYEEQLVNLFGTSVDLSEPSP